VSQLFDLFPDILAVVLDNLSYPFSEWREDARDVVQSNDYQIAATVPRTYICYTLQKQDISRKCRIAEN
jgi:hypothetical protein